ncbi:MAG: YgjV family protein [Clostridia bacterium]|nr:YgjV family protein [Clostridia bacterium]
MLFEILTFLTSFIAMALIAASYFFSNKKFYLLFQSLGIVFLIASYLFGGQYFAMIGLFVGLLRTLTYYAFENKGKPAPIELAFLFSALTIASYGFVNFLILKTAQPLDLICLVSLVLYAFTFRIRDLKIMRFLTLVPTVLSIAYNALIGAAVFTVVSYSFELGANILSIFKYHIFKNKKPNAWRL